MDGKAPPPQPGLHLEAVADAQPGKTTRDALDAVLIPDLGGISNSYLPRPAASSLVVQLHKQAAANGSPHAGFFLDLRTAIDSAAHGQILSRLSKLREHWADKLDGENVFDLCRHAIDNKAAAADAAEGSSTEAQLDRLDEMLAMIRDDESADAPDRASSQNVALPDSKRWSPFLSDEHEAAAKLVGEMQSDAKARGAPNAEFFKDAGDALLQVKHRGLGNAVDELQSRWRHLTITQGLSELVDVAANRGAHGKSRHPASELIDLLNQVAIQEKAADGGDSDSDDDQTFD